MNDFERAVENLDIKSIKENIHKYNILDAASAIKSICRNFTNTHISDVHIEMLDILFDSKKVPVNFEDNTFIKNAIYYDNGTNEKIIAYLIKKGANLRVRSVYFPLFSWCAKNNNIKILKLAISKKANVYQYVTKTHPNKGKIYGAAGQVFDLYGKLYDDPNNKMAKNLLKILLSQST